MKLKQYLDWPLVASFIFLTGLGLAVIYSAAFPKAELSFFYKQIIFFILGLLLMVATAIFVDYRRLRSNSFLVLSLYLFFLILLGGLFFFPSIRDVHGWYKLGPFTFDPVPFAQLGLIIILAKYFSTRHPLVKQWPVLFISSLYALIPAILVFLQPDFGSASIFILIWIGLVLVSGLKWKHLFLLLTLSIIFGGLIWSFGLHDYQRNRVISFIHPSSAAAAHHDWQVRQSMIALGSGKLIGKGWEHNSQARYGFLPEARTDFIFSVIAEEFGLLGVICVFTLFFVIIWRLTKIGWQADNNFAYFLSLGYLIWLTAQSFLSIGMNLGFLPVVGVPLPLVSYGGSSLIAFYIGGGLVMNTRFWTT